MIPVLGLVLILASCGGLWAETDVPLPGTLEECLLLGFRHSRVLTASQLQARSADSRLLEARAQRLPGLTASARYSRLSPVEPGSLTLPPPSSASIQLTPQSDDSAFLALSLQQSLFAGFGVQAGIDQAEHLAAEARLNLLRAEQELRFEIQTAYWSLIRALEVERVIKESIEQVNAHLREVKDLFAQGLVTANDVLQVEMQLANTVLRRIEAGNTLSLAGARLSLLLGLPYDTVLRPAPTPLHPLQEPESLEGLLKQALRSRPELAASAERIHAQEKTMAVARSSFYPSLFLSAGLLTARPNSRFFPPENSFKTTWELGIGGSLEIGRWSASARQVEQARLQLAQGQEGLALLEEGITLEVIQSFLELKKAREQVSVARLIVCQAEENHRVVREKFLSGLALNSQLLDAELSLLEAGLTLTQAGIDHELAWAALEKAVSVEPTRGQR